MKHNKFYLWVIAFFLFQLIGLSNGIADDFDNLPVKGMVTMIDLGAKKCIPCKMMAPIIEQLQEEYKGRASVIFIDVWEQPQHAKRFGVRSIPTQIFYDKEGKEFGRHAGFLDKKSIMATLESLGVPKEIANDKRTPEHTTKSN